MKALLFEEYGEPLEVLRVQNIAEPAPGPGEIRVRVMRSPIQPSDLHVIRGRFGRQPPLPASPGLEGMGAVDALGEGVAGLTVGTRVVFVNVPGLWREKIVCTADRVIPVPDALSDDVAAQALVNPVTALMLTIVEHKLARGEWLVQTAAGSTVGRLVLQLAQAEGFKTINLVRRRDQISDIVHEGGHVVICTEDEDWPQRVAAAAGVQGIGKAIDCVAGRTGARLARHLAPGGRLLVYGALSSHRQSAPVAFELPIFTPRLIYGATTVQGWYLFHWLDVAPLQTVRKMMMDALDRLACGSLRLPETKTFAAAEIQSALFAAEASGPGKKPILDLTQL